MVRAAKLVSWKAPDGGWWKSNADGSVLATWGAAGVGGFIPQLSVSSFNDPCFENNLNNILY